MKDKKTEKSNNQLALANIGIIALIDEVTSYQNVRGKGDLNKLYKGYLKKGKGEKKNERQ